MWRANVCCRKYNRDNSRDHIYFAQIKGAFFSILILDKLGPLILYIKKRKICSKAIIYFICAQTIVREKRKHIFQC